MSESTGRDSPAASGGGEAGTNSAAQRRDRTFSASDVEIELEGWQASCCCHPQALFHRSLVIDPKLKTYRGGDKFSIHVF